MQPRPFSADGETSDLRMGGRGRSATSTSAPWRAFATAVVRSRFAVTPERTCRFNDNPSWNRTPSFRLQGTWVGCRYFRPHRRAVFAKAWDSYRHRGYCDRQRRTATDPTMFLSRPGRRNDVRHIGSGLGDQACASKAANATRSGRRYQRPVIPRTFRGLCNALAVFARRCPHRKGVALNIRGRGRWGAAPGKARR